MTCHYLASCTHTTLSKHARLVCALGLYWPSSTDSSLYILNRWQFTSQNIFMKNEWFWTHFIMPHTHYFQILPFTIFINCFQNFLLISSITKNISPVLMKLTPSSIIAIHPPGRRMSLPKKTQFPKGSLAYLLLQKNLSFITNCLYLGFNTCNLITTPYLNGLVLQKYFINDKINISSV